MANIKGAKISVTASAALVPFGDSQRAHTLTNLDTSNSVWYRFAPNLQTTFAGTASELDALFGSELKAGESVVLDPSGSGINVVCATGLTATLRVMAGRTVAPSPTDVPSILYDGGATGALQVDATAATVIASTADVISVGAANLIRVWLSHPTAAQTCTFKVSQFSDATPAVANQTGQFERVIGTADHTSLVDSAAFGLTTGTDHQVKDMIEFSIAPGSHLMLGLSAGTGGAGTWYARYELRYE